MSRHTISARWLLPAALLTLLVLPAATGIGVWVLEGQRQQDDLTRRLSQASAWIRAHVDPDTAAVPRAELRRRLDRLDLHAQLTLIAADAKSSLYTSPDLMDPRVVKKLNDLVRPGKPATGFDPPIADASENLAHRSITVSRDPTGNGPIVIADLYYAPLDRTFRALLAVTSGAALLLAGLALAAWLPGRWLVKPLRQLSLQVDRIAGGERPLAHTPSRVSEVETVSAALHEMAVELERSGERDARLEEARRFLVTAIAHDLRTPLFSLRGYLEAIAEGIGDASDHLPRAQTKAAQIDRLVGSLFTYARGEYLDESPSLEVADLGEAVRATLAGFEPAMRPRGVTYRVTGDDGVLALLDRDRLERVLGNVVDNAVRYSTAGGTIEAVLEQRDGFASVTIADDGPGIDAADLPHIFDPAYRSDDSRRSHTGGAGLGLTIARRLMEAQGGTIDARNGERGGALFIVRLPSRERTAEASGPSPETRSESRVTTG